MVDRFEKSCDMASEKSNGLNFSQRRVLDVVRRHISIPRSDIAPLTSQTPGAISRLVRELISLGLLSELDRISGMRGQPAQPLGINGQGGVSIGISLPYGRLDVVALDYAGRQLTVRKLRFEDRSFEALRDALLLHLNSVLNEENVRDLRFIGIGLAIPGHLRAEWSNDFVVPSTLDWLDVDLLATWLTKTYKAPVFVENIANAAAIAEIYAGEETGLNNLVAVNLGHGVGCGLVLSRRVHRGMNGVAGEVGSLYPPLHPRPSVHDLVMVMRSGGRTVLHIDDLKNYPVEGDDLLEAWVERAAQQLFKLIRMLHLVVAPQKIVITGMLPSNIAGPLAARLASQLDAEVESTSLPRTQIAPTQLSTLGSAIGGAWLPIESEGLDGKDRAEWCSGKNNK